MRNSVERESPLDSGSLQGVGEENQAGREEQGTKTCENKQFGPEKAQRCSLQQGEAHRRERMGEGNERCETLQRSWQRIDWEQGSGEKPQGRTKKPHYGRTLLHRNLNRGRRYADCDRGSYRKSEHQQTAKKVGCMKRNTKQQQTAC